MTNNRWVWSGLYIDHRASSGWIGGRIQARLQPSCLSGQVVWANGERHIPCHQVYHLAQGRTEGSSRDSWFRRWLLMPWFRRTHLIYWSQQGQCNALHFRNQTYEQQHRQENCGARQLKEYRRNNGLCFSCGEKFSLGHMCANTPLDTTQVQAMEIVAAT